MESNELWSCLVLECNAPATVKNGYANISDDGTTANYECEVGYSIAGITKRFCQTDGSGWDRQQPTCGNFDVMT